MPLHSSFNIDNKDLVLSNDIWDETRIRSKWKIYATNTVSFIDIYKLRHLGLMFHVLLFFYLHSLVVAAWRNSEADPRPRREEINREFGGK